MRWFLAAAGKGDREAQCSLGRCYANGEGVVRDEAQAVHWYREAAAAGHADARRRLDSLRRALTA